MMPEGDVLIHSNIHTCIRSAKMMKTVWLHALANGFRLVWEILQSPVEGKRKGFMF